LKLSCPHALAGAAATLALGRAGSVRAAGPRLTIAVPLPPRTCRPTSVTKRNR